MEVYSLLMEDTGFAPLPTYYSIPSHGAMKEDELIFTTYKVAVQIHSRSSHCKWLTEIYLENPAWINLKTTGALGLKNGD